MPRRMSFSKTVAQMRARTKTVTRRLGWTFLKKGDRVTAVEKTMGLRKGEKQVVLGDIEVVDVRRERLVDVTQEDCAAEGFPDLGPKGFVELFCAMGGPGTGTETAVTRIEFKHLCTARAPIQPWQPGGYDRACHPDEHDGSCPHCGTDRWRYRCTEKEPWTPQVGRGYHPDAVVIDEQDGWPGGDIVSYKCPNCGLEFDEELPQ